jgi:hypothetical protein
MDPSRARESRVASLTRRDLIAIGAINALAIIVALILGALGPPVEISEAAGPGGAWTAVRRDRGVEAWSGWEWRGCVGSWQRSGGVAADVEREGGVPGEF